MNTLKNVLKSIWGWIKRTVLSNFWQKVFSLVLAVAMWCFVLTNDTTITRERTLTNMYVTTTNQSTLDSRQLAITEVLSDILPQVRVSIEVTQGDYYRVTSNNVRVELDLSRIRETGEQTIPLTASTVYGTVTGIYPDAVTLNVDELATRNVQVEVQLKGTDDAECWYSTPISNPTIVTVTGPASQVEQVTNARAVMDLTELKTTGQVTRAVAFALLDEHQNPVEYGTLSTSTSSVITSVEAYPVENIPVETDLAKIITGSVPTGYQLDSVDVQPSEIAVAGAQRFLDSLSAVQIYSINVNNMKETTTKTTRVNRQSDMRYLSTEEVLVTLHISEKQRTHVYEQLVPELTGEPASPLLRAGVESGACFTATVTGPYTQMTALERDRIRLFADVSGLTAGTYELPVHWEIEDGDGMEVTISPATVTVTIE